MVRRFDEGVHLPDFIGREAQPEGRHLRALPAVDHSIEKLFVAEFRLEEIGPARAGAVVTDVAFARVNHSPGSYRIGLAEKRIGKFLSRSTTGKEQQACNYRQERSETSELRPHRSPPQPHVYGL